MADEPLDEQANMALLTTVNQLTKENETLKEKVQTLDDKIITSYRKAGDFQQEIERLKTQLNAQKVQRLADVKAAIILQRVSNSGLTHRSKDQLTQSITTVLQEYTKEIANSINVVNLNGDELPF